ncbi:MAG: NADH-quinone oxidoreductase subunit C/D, partial [Deltaproteobacteria bacterium]|nr:NADH-quinone oxidoreductase subunit C/D [Deltaproteobacteria bacterium]
MEEAPDIQTELENKFGTGLLSPQGTRDDIPTFWVPKERILETLRYLKRDIPGPFAMLYDLTAIDERLRNHRDGQPESDFSV